MRRINESVLMWDAQTGRQRQLAVTVSSAIGRKRTLISTVFGVIERPVSGKADIPEYPQDFHKIDQLGTSALRPEADIELESVQ
jgi:hypothetical protein